MNTEKIIDAMVEQVQASLREPVSDEQLDRLRENIKTKVEQGEALRKVELGNWDEPDFVFVARRRDS